MSLLSSSPIGRDRKVLVVLVASVMLIIAAVLVMLHNLNRLSESRNEVGHMFKILASISETLEGVRAAVPGQHGFLLTDDRKALVRHEQGFQSISGKPDTLNALVRDREQRQHVLPLRQAVADEIDALGRTLDPALGSLGTARTSEGIHAVSETKRVEAIVQTMRERENELLDQRARADRQTLERSTATALLAAAMAVATSILGAVLVVRRRGQAARLRAEQANAAKTEFLATMNHEIRTPLHALLGSAELILEELQPGSAAHRHATRIQIAGLSLLTIVNDVLDFSKIESGSLRLNRTDFDLHNLIEDTIFLVRLEAEAKGLKIDTMIAKCTPRFVVGDQDRLRQVLLNLLNNAIKFTPSGKVTLSVRALKIEDSFAHLEFDVVDTGIGIPQEKQDLLFQRFSQVDGTNERGFGGTGLGLAISKRLIESMKGRIGVHSREGGGSTFWFDLVLPTATEPTSPMLEENPKPGRPCRILVVEDVPVNQELAATMLGSGGHDVDVVSDGSAAIRAVQVRAYDLVFMDIQMPGMGGLTATRWIRAMPEPISTLPIVALTANAFEQQIPALRAAGIDDHVAKPFTRAVLLEAVERWTERTDTGGARADIEMDKSVFSEMMQIVGRDRMRELLIDLAAELQARFMTFEAVDDRAKLAMDAHAMVAATGTLGFVDLASLCREIEAACTEGREHRPLLDALRTRTRETLEEIAVLRAA